MQRLVIYLHIVIVSVAFVCCIKEEFIKSFLILISHFLLSKGIEVNTGDTPYEMMIAEVSAHIYK